MEDKILKAEIRKDTGKKYSKMIRNQEKTPGVFYSKKMGSIPFECLTRELKNIERYESKVVTISLNNKNHTGLVREVQYDPVSEKIIHVDIMGVDLQKKVLLEVPTVTIGTAVGVKTFGGILEHITHKIEIECLAKDIPEKIEIDVSELNIGESLHVQDINIEDAKIISKPDLVIVTVVPPSVIVEEVKAEEVEEVEGEEGEEPETDQKEKEKESKVGKEAKAEKEDKKEEKK